MNDATRETGGTLGVAIIGSVYTSLYTTRLTTTATGLSHAAPGRAQPSVVAAIDWPRAAPFGKHLKPTPRKDRAMPSPSQSTIQAGAPLVTLINVFTVDPADQERLVELWQQATDDVMRHIPGFISANVHRSLDGTKVVNYAQWESQEAFQTMLSDPDASPLLRELAEIATPAPVLCEVVSVHHV